MAGCGHMRKDQPRIGANRKSKICSPLRAYSPRLNPPFGRDNRICLSSLEHGGSNRKSKICSQVYRLAQLRDLKVPASAEVVRFQRSTRQRKHEKGSRGGRTKVWIEDGIVCVKLKNNNWYHYTDSYTWY